MVERGEEEEGEEGGEEEEESSNLKSNNPTPDGWGKGQRYEKRSTHWTLGTDTCI